MRTAALALLVLPLATPVAAQFIRQPYTPAPRDTRPAPTYSEPVVGPGDQGRDIRRDIARGQRSGQFSRGEAHALRRQADLIDTLASRYGRDGLSDDEAAELQNRSIALREQVDNARVMRTTR